MYPLHHYSQAMYTATLGVKLLCAPAVHSLSDSDMLRMLSAAGIATRAAPQLLAACTRWVHFSADPRVAETATRCLLKGALSLTEAAMTALQSDMLPDRVQRAAQATTFQPGLLLHWLRAVAAAMQAIGEGCLPAVQDGAVRCARRRAGWGCALRPSPCTPGM